MITALSDGLTRSIGVDRGVEQLTRRTLLRPHQLGLRGRVEVDKFDHLRFAIAFFIDSALLTWVTLPSGP